MTDHERLLTGLFFVDFLCITSRVKATVIQIRAGHALSGCVRSYHTGLGGN